MEGRRGDGDRHRHGGRERERVQGERSTLGSKTEGVGRDDRYGGKGNGIDSSMGKDKSSI